MPGLIPEERCLLSGAYCTNRLPDRERCRTWVAANEAARMAALPEGSRRRVLTRHEPSTLSGVAPGYKFRQFADRRHHGRRWFDGAVFGAAPGSGMSYLVMLIVSDAQYP